VQPQISWPGLCYISTSGLTNDRKGNHGLRWSTNLTIAEVGVGAEYLTNRVSAKAKQGSSRSPMLRGSEINRQVGNVAIFLAGLFLTVRPAP
jgi:hypothetical protein